MDGIKWKRLKNQEEFISELMHDDGRCMIDVRLGMLTFDFSGSARDLKPEY